MQENESQEQSQEQKGLIVMNDILTKNSKETVAKIKANVLSGESNAAYIGVALKKLHKIAETLKEDKEFQNAVETETKKFQEGGVKTFTCYGAKITIADGGFWDFSQTDDEYLKRLKEIEKEVKVLIKNREDAIKLQKSEWDMKNSPMNVQNFGLKPFTVTWNELPELVWNEGYGETNTNPPVKRGKEQFRYSL